jgi:hypothetical protein
VFGWPAVGGHGGEGPVVGGVDAGGGLGLFGF